MSTDRSKKKRKIPRVERIKVLEYGLIALVVLSFVGLAIFYGTRKTNPDAAAEAAPTETPEPTEDPSIRGMSVLNALEKAGYAVTYRQDRYDLVSPDGVALEMRMVSDDAGIQTLSFETVLCPDIDGDAEFARITNEQNRQTLAALRSLFDCVLPVFRRTAADSDTIVKQCQKVVKSFETYSMHKGRYSVRITSDAEAIPQTVVITLIRDA